MNYIKTVLPMKDYRLFMEMESGNTVTVVLSGKLHTMKYGQLADETFFKTAATDISDHWAKDSIMKMINAGVISGYPDGTFKPDKAVTRAEAAIIIGKLI